ncbi:bifunctional UDP-N-acetylglucosamine diphosphorylase/glucosamine-1-phosphate N-acetyltransferase GlmU [Ahrensia marina]|uniref:bifunctional UDP-N-acetylglucosamine diphosphorylase/glucosamine-1-phosphate N-acetyltransferase GlmU n=1 Tax=Ahrensia marina TaxID=1514904 RepID=UPI0035CFD167
MSSSNRQPQAIILAAGEGTRMRSSLPKVLHKVGHLPLIAHVMKAASAAGLSHPRLVLGHGRDEVEQDLQSRGFVFDVAEQKERLGTGHAVMMVRDAGQLPDGPVMVLLGDAPLIKPELISGALDRLDEGADVVVVGFEAADPTGYGRLIVSGDSLEAIVEEKEATAEQRETTLCNSGLMAFSAGVLGPLLGEISNDNAKGEFYLTDAIAIAREAGKKVAYTLAEEADLAGVNNRADLAAVEAEFQSRKRRELMLGGVTMLAPDTVTLAHDTQIAPDVTLEPNIVFGSGVTIEGGATIHAFCHLEGAHVKGGAAIGPFARLRPGADIGEAAKVGNFSEVKNADVAAGAKINHLSYIGDASIGEKANIGAGTITCNYDGVSKHKTTVGKNAFIGSNSSLVAPVSVEDGGYVGSGSVITKDVPSGDLAIGRGRQVNLPGRAPKLTKK